MFFESYFDFFCNFAAHKIHNYNKMNIFYAISLFLTFRFVGGGVVSVPTESLSMNIVEDQLYVSGPQVNEKFDLTALESMEFTDEYSSLTDIGSEDAVSAYSLKGELIGDFKSISDAEKSLEKGIYLLKMENKTIKKIIE